MLTSVTIPSIEKAFDPLAWKGGKIPLPTNAEVTALAKNLREQSMDGYVKVYGWALPTYELFEKVLRYMVDSGTKELLGLYSGGACIESLFQHAGLNVVATDKHTDSNGSYVIDGSDLLLRGQFRMDVKSLDAYKAIRDYPHRALFMSWPQETSLRPVGNAIAATKVPSGTFVFVVNSTKTWENDFLGKPFGKNLEVIEECPLARHPNAAPSYLHVFRILKPRN